MNFVDLYYFLATAEEMNFTKTAEKLFITQQSLSSRIAKLEKEYNTMLFDRTPPLSLTPAGICLFKHAKFILSQKQLLDTEMQNVLNEKNSILTVGIQNDRGTVFVPHVLTNFRKSYPNVHLNFFEDTSSKVLDSLYNGKADCIIGFPSEADGVTSITLFRETFYVMIPLNILEKYYSPEEQAQMLRAESLPISIFCRCPLLAYTQSTWLKDIFIENCNNLHMLPNIVMDTSNVMSRSSMCFAGLGIMFIAGSFLNKNTRFINSNQLKLVHCFTINDENFSRDISISFLKRHQNKCVKEFVKIAKQTASDLFS